MYSEFGVMFICCVFINRNHSCKYVTWQLI